MSHKTYDTRENYLRPSVSLRLRQALAAAWFLATVLVAVFITTLTSVDGQTAKLAPPAYLKERLGDTDRIILKGLVRTTLDGYQLEPQPQTIDDPDTISKIVSAALEWKRDVGGSGGTPGRGGEVDESWNRRWVLECLRPKEKGDAKTEPVEIHFSFEKKLMYLLDFFPPEDFDESMTRHHGFFFLPENLKTTLEPFVARANDNAQTIVSNEEQIENVPEDTKCLKGQFNADLSGERLKGLSRLSKLAFVDLTNTHLTDDDLRHLGALRQLESLDLSGNTGIKGEGVEHLVTVTSLKKLVFAGSRALSAKAFAQLCSLSNLEHLDLSQNRLEGASGTWHEASAGLEKLRSLRTLVWSNAYIGVDVLENIGRLTWLEHLDLSGNMYRALECPEVGLDENGKPIWRGAVGNDGIAKLTSLTSLKSLNLDYTQIDDGCIDDLIKLTSLKELSLRWQSSGEGITAEGIARLRKALPECVIHTNIEVEQNGEDQEKDQ